MKIAISNIAWNKEEDKVILPILKKYSISGVEIAPTKIWDDPISQSSEEIKAYRKYWEKEGISISSTQSILFGHPELNIFESLEKRKLTLLYIEKMIRVSALLGASAIVFGSPKNRDTKGMEIKQSLDIAADFFYKIGEIAESYETFFCIEPNPKVYGTNFVNTTKEALVVIKRVNHPYFRLHLDSGALSVNKEDYKSAITEGFPYLKHFHVSERDLLPIGSTSLDHKEIASVLKLLHYNRWISVEMRGNNFQNNDKIVEKTLAYVSAAYA